MVRKLTSGLERMVASEQIDAICVEHQILIGHAVLATPLGKHFVPQGPDTCGR